jgi:hypothetical protein
MTVPSSQGRSPRAMTTPDSAPPGHEFFNASESYWSSMVTMSTSGLAGDWRSFHTSCSLSASAATRARRRRRAHRANRRRRPPGTRRPAPAPPATRLVSQLGKQVGLPTPASQLPAPRLGGPAQPAPRRPAVQRVPHLARRTCSSRRRPWLQVWRRTIRRGIRSPIRPPATAPMGGNGQHPLCPTGKRVGSRSRSSGRDLLPIDGHVEEERLTERPLPPPPYPCTTGDSLGNLSLQRRPRAGRCK